MKDDNGPRTRRGNRPFQATVRGQTFSVVMGENIPHHNLEFRQQLDLISGNSAIRRSKERALTGHRILVTGYRCGMR